MHDSRRIFIKKAGIGALAAGFFSGIPYEVLASNSTPVERADLILYNRLLKDWCDGMISVQGQDKNIPATYGGFMCPACGFIHGRSHEAAFPLLYMANHTGHEKYRKAAIDVFNWGEKNVSQQDGSWFNDVTANPWKGITIFGAAGLGESLKYYSPLLDNDTRQQWTLRLRKACDFIYGFIQADTSNINYPLCSSYPLVLGGKLLKEQKFIDKGRELAELVYDYLSPGSSFIYGELKPRTKSPRGFWPVDLSYNVEETLPTLTLYALEMQDKRMLDTVINSWKTHLEFMLPDGGWDDSFGTRNHKWTYWGSRNSDGCQAGLVLLGEYDPVFSEAAYRNGQMLDKCTHNGFLYGGPGYVSHGVKPCIHHNFAHAKSLASLLSEKEIADKPFIRSTLPRENGEALKEFKDIGTYLVSVGKWKATVTSNDTEYRVSPHASGGSISLLYHENMGLILTDSLFPELKHRERSNMQDNEDKLQLLLTPRLEMVINGIPYRSSRDVNALITSEPIKKGVHLKINGKLVSHDLKDTPAGAAEFEMDYLFTDAGVEIRSIAKNIPGNGELSFYLPLVSPADEVVSVISTKSIALNKANGKLKITTSGTLNILSSDKNRVFSQSPGVEAIPLKIDWDIKRSPELMISITSKNG